MGNIFFDKEFWENSTVEKVEQAISTGAKINAKNDKGHNALIFASVFCTKPSVIRKLLDKRAKQVDQAIELALAYNSKPKEIVKTLVLDGDTYFVNKFVNKKDFFDLIKRNPILKDKDPEKLYVDLHPNILFDKEYMKTASAENIINLISNGADVNLKNKNNFFCYTPLMLSLQYNKGFDVVQKLLRMGADVNAKWNVDETVLMLALKYNHDAKLIKILLDAGAHINIKGRTFNDCDVTSGGFIFGEPVADDVTPLMYASQYNEHPEVLDLLLEKSTLFLKTFDSNGKTALMYATQYNKNPDVVLVLLNHGKINITKKDRYGKTAYDYILENQYLKDSVACKQLKKRLEN